MSGKIDKYIIEKELGQGGFGRVYKAFDPDVGQSVAIKKLLAHGDPDVLKRFQLEIRTTASLSHKNIVRIYSSGEESGDPYLVMELLEGSTIKQIVQQHHPLSLLDRVRIMTQVAEGLGYAHSKGVVHRDVKPENIMLLSDGTVKVMDFGIALGPNRKTAVTQTGGMIGTPLYFAPEQLEGFKANEQTDIFSFGDVYYELLTSMHPFERFKSDWKSLHTAIISYEPQALSELVPGCPEALETLVHRTLAKDPEFRYQKFAEIQLDSEAILVDLKHEDAAAIVRLVDSLIDSGDLETALGKINKAFQLDPGNRDIRRKRDEIIHRLRKDQVEARINRMLADAEALVTERRYPEAVQTLESIVKLDSTHRVATERLREVKALLEGYHRANRFVAEGRSLQQKGRLDEAYDRYQKALEIVPDHTDARRLGHYVGEQLAQKRVDQRRREAIRAAREQAAAGRFDLALEVLNQTLKELSGDQSLDEVRAEILEAKAEEGRRQRAENFHLAAAKMLETLQVGDLTRARQMLALLDANFASDPGTAEVLGRLRVRLEMLARAREVSQYKERAHLLLKEDSVREAMDLLTVALDKYPADTGLEQMYHLVNDRYQAHQRSEAIAALLQETSSKRGAGDLQEALKLVSRGRQDFGDDARLVDLTRQLELEIEQQRYSDELENLLGDCRSSMAAGRYAEALALLDHAGEFSGEAAVIVLREQARTATTLDEERRFVTDVLSTAAKLQSEGALSRALSKAEEGLARYPQDQGLQGAADRLREEIRKELRNQAIAKHRSAIWLEIQNGSWSRAETELIRARTEFPDDPGFDDLADEVKRGAYESGWHAFESGVQRVLATGDPVKAKRKLADAVSATVYASDPRWQTLEQNIDERIAYEETLVMAERQRNVNRFSEAEELLTQVINRGAPDQRANEMRGVIQRQRSEAFCQQEIRKIADEVRRHLEQSSLGQAESRLFAARTRYPGEIVWDDLEVRLSALRRAAGVGAAEAEIRLSLSSHDIPNARSQLAAARLKYPGEARWTACQQEIDRQAEIAAASENLGQRLGRRHGAVSSDALQGQRREDLELAAAELATARTRHGDGPVWSGWQSEIDARRAFLDQEDDIGARAKEELERGEISEARSRLIAARTQFPDEDLWSLLLAEADRYEERLKAGQEVAEVANLIWELLHKDDLRAASDHLAEARAKYPCEELWGKLQAAIVSRQETLQQESEIAKTAAAVRSLLRQGIRNALLAAVDAPSRSYPISQVWGVLRDAAERLQQGRIRYSGDAPWTSLAAEIAECRNKLEHEITVSVRACADLGALDWDLADLANARGRYPGEPFWAVLQAEIESAREPLDRASLTDFTSRVRRSMEQADLPDALRHLTEARKRHPDAHIWDELQAEIDARIRRLNVVETSERIVREQLAQSGRQSAELDWLGIHRFQKAEAVLTETQAEYPGEECLAELQRDVTVQRGEWKIRLGNGIANLLQQHPDRPTVESLRSKIRVLRDTEPDELLWEQFEGEAARVAAVLERQSEVASCGERVRQYMLRDDARQATAELDASRKRYPDEPLWAELESELRQKRDRARDRLQDLEQQMASEPRKRKKKEIVQAVAALVGGYPEDAEMAGIAARVRALADAPSSAPASQKQLPWKAVATVAPALVAAAGFYAWLNNRTSIVKPTPVHKDTGTHAGGTASSTVSFEIRTDPEGAEVRLDDRFCKTPSCRFDIAPGSHQLEANLDGYEALHQAVTVTSSDRLLDLTLKRVSRPPKPSETGTLIVETGMEDVLISVDREAGPRTDPSGAKTLSLKAGMHEVTVARNGYEPVAPRRVSIGAGSRQMLPFRLKPLPARLELSGAPAGVEIRIGGGSLGRTDGSTPFIFQAIAPGDHELEISLGQARGRLSQQHFVPGQPTRLNWKDVSSVLPMPPPPRPGDTSKDGTIPIVHIPVDDPAELQKRIWDSQWASVHPDNIDEVRAFCRDHPDNVHAPEAKKIIDAYEALKRAEEQTRKKQEWEGQVRSTLNGVNSVMQPRKTNDLKKNLWPSVSADMIRALESPRVKIAFDASSLIFKSVQDNQIDATCDLVTTDSNVKPASVSRQKWTLVFQNKGGVWTIATAQVSRN